MGPNGNENFKMLLLQIAEKGIQTCPEFLPMGGYKATFGIFEIWSFRFLTNFFFRKFQIHLWRNQKPQKKKKKKSDCIAKLSEIWDSRVL